MATGANENQDLTLHRGIVRRWAGPRALAERQTAQAGAAVLSAEKLLTRLPGLGSWTGTFSPAAWQLATLVASDSQLLQRLSLETRSMSVAELADLVQLVLEEDEGLDGDVELELEELARAQTAVAGRKSAQNQQKQTKVGKAMQPGPGQRRKLAAVRRVVQQLRAEQQSFDAPRAAVSQQPETLDPTQVGRLHPETPPEPPSVAQTPGREPLLGPATPRLRPKSQPASTRRPLTALAEPPNSGAALPAMALAARPSRALQWALESVDRPLLAIAAESVAQDAEASEYSSVSASRHAAPAVRSSAPVTGTRPAVAEALESVRGASAPRANPARAAVSAGVATAAPSRLPALAASLGFAARGLAREVRARTAVSVASRAVSRSAAAAAQEMPSLAGESASRTAKTDAAVGPAAPFVRMPSRRPAFDAASPAASAARADAIVEMAAAFSRSKASGFDANPIVARWSRWFAGTEAARRGEPPAAAAPVGTARETSAGELLAPSAEVGFEASESAGEAAVVPVARASAAARRAAAATAWPEWLVAQKSASSQRSATASVEPGAAPRAEGVDAVALEAPRAARNAPASSAFAGLGEAGLAAAGLAERLDGRHAGGLRAPSERLAELRTVSEAWLPVAGPAFAVGRAQRAAPSAAWATASGGGEWLLLQSEARLDAESSAAEADSASDSARETPRVSGSARAAVDGRSAPAAVAAPAAQASTWFRAAAAAVERVIAQARRRFVPESAAAATPAAAEATAVASGRAATARSSIFELARAVAADPLAAAPAGVRDAMTPWLERRAARAGRPAAARQADQAPVAEFLDLSTEAAEAATAADMPSASDETPVVSARAQKTASAGVAAIATARQADARASARPEALATATGARRHALAAALGNVHEPAALRAALALFGAFPERVAADPVLSARFARIFGAAPIERRPAVSARSAAESGTGEFLALRDGANVAEADSPGRPASTARSADASPAGEVVLTGLAALAALRQTPADREASLANRTLTLPETARELLEPDADAAAAPTPSTLSPARKSRALSTAASLQGFAPVGLRRGRNLLATTRKQTGLVRMTPRSRSMSRAGYGSSALGGGELLGLTPGDPSSFFGDVEGLPHAAMGASRLGQDVFERRSAHPRQRPTTAAASDVAMDLIAPAQLDGPASLPSDFSFGAERSYCEPAAVQAAVSEQQRSAGATAAARSVQAGAMARVLSVTSTPSANVLPLVAPAAHAVVAAAAAKPLSESIVTSGADPTAALPLLGQSTHHGGHADQRHEAAHQAEQTSQDLDALAMKIARQVLVRMKKERERRGLHG